MIFRSIRMLIWLSYNYSYINNLTINEYSSKAKYYLRSKYILHTLKTFNEFQIVSV